MYFYSFDYFININPFYCKESDILRLLKQYFLYTFLQTLIFYEMLKICWSADWLQYKLINRFLYHVNSEKCGGVVIANKDLSDVWSIIVDVIWLKIRLPNWQRHHLEIKHFQNPLQLVFVKWNSHVWLKKNILKHVIYLLCQILPRHHKLFKVKKNLHCKTS